MRNKEMLSNHLNRSTRENAIHLKDIMETSHVAVFFIMQGVHIIADLRVISSASGIKLFYLPSVQQIIQ